MGKTKEDYIQLQQEMQERMKTSNDPNHWSAVAEMLQQVIDEEEMWKLKLQN